MAHVEIFNPDWEPDFDDSEKIEVDFNCPNCGCEYDEIDFEYQICHYCNFNNFKKPIGG